MQSRDTERLHRHPPAEWFCLELSSQIVASRHKSLLSEFLNLPIAPSPTVWLSAPADMRTGCVLLDLSKPRSEQWSHVLAALSFPSSRCT